jgi:hypothetical protein
MEVRNVLEQIRTALPETEAAKTGSPVAGPGRRVAVRKSGPPAFRVPSIFNGTAALALFLLTAFLAGACGNAAAGQPEGFGDLKWGTKPQPEMKLLGTLPEGSAMYIRPPNTPPRKLFGMPLAGEVYFFKVKGLYRASGWMYGEADFQKLKREALRSFGSPDVVNEAAGMWKWSWGMGGVQAELTFDTSEKKGVINISTSSILSSEALAAPRSGTIQ